MAHFSKHMWLVYILKCKDGSLYTGITRDINARLKAHNAGKGAKYTRSRLPVSLAYQEQVSSRSKATVREYQIKSFSAVEKRKLIKQKRAIKRAKATLS